MSDEMRAGAVPNPAKELFPLGRVLATPGALEALEEHGESAETYLKRHTSGDWGDLNEDDKKLNDLAVEGGDRIFSSYKLKDGSKIWIITEHDRSATTVLLPDEY